MIATANIASLNFLYRFLSGGASELWGKYGGGVYVAIYLFLHFNAWLSAQVGVFDGFDEGVSPPCSSFLSSSSFFFFSKSS